MNKETATKLRMIAAVLSFYDDPMLTAAREELRALIRAETADRKALPAGSIPDWRETEQNEQHKA